jgi:C1A family cysteine protease
MPGIRSLFGLIEDAADPRDRPFHLSSVAPPTPQAVDLSSHLPGAWHQGGLGSCTANACAGLLSYLHPGHLPSRLALYYETRELEGTVDRDAGSQIRDAMKVMQKQGVVSEDLWPYDEARFAEEPTNNGVDPQRTIANYSRLNTLQDMLDCLSMLFPFVLSIDLPDYFDAEAGAKGVMPLATGPVGTLGLHAMLAVGFDREFHNNPDFIASGLDDAAVEPTMFLVRNSWGVHWGNAGHFWLPASWLTNRSTVGDCWTGFPLFTNANSPQGSTVAGVPVDGTFKDVT